MLKFKKPLKEALILRRNSRFTFEVDFGGKKQICECPTSSKIGDIELRNLPCLVSEQPSSGFCVEALSLDKPDKDNKTWIGINPCLGKALIEKAIKADGIKGLFNKSFRLYKDVDFAGFSMDYKTGSSYIETVFDLSVIQLPYGDNINIKAQKPCLGTYRFLRHVNELAYNIKEGERVDILRLYQYEIKTKKPEEQAESLEYVKESIAYCRKKGLEVYQLQMRFEKDRIELKSVNTADETMFEVV